MSIEVVLVPGTFGPSDAERDVPLWRYLSVQGLLLTLSRGLNFTRLRAFDDRHDGRLTEGGTVAYVEWWLNQELPRLLSRIDSLPDKYRSRERKALSKIDPDAWALRARDELVASCWCIGPDESMAMWDIYAPGPTGTAIVSSGSRLRAALAGIDDYVSEQLAGIDIAHIGRVRYAGEGQQVEHVRQGEIRSLIDFSLVKRAAFAHEREARIVAIHTSTDERIVLPWVDPMLPRSSTQDQRAKILKDLVDEVVVSPRASDQDLAGIKYLVEQVAPEVSPRVRRSTLLDPPPTREARLPPRG